MIRAILNFFGVGGDKTQPLTEGKTKTNVKVQNVSAVPTERPPAPIPVPVAAQKKRKRHAPQKRTVTKSSVNAKKYYKRGGSFYSIDDDSLIDDVLMLVVLAELFDDGDITDMDVAVESTAPAEEDLLDIDVSDTPVVEAPSYTPDEPSYTEPEPVKQESAGSSYGSGSSDYDSGDSDSGGSDD